MRITIKRLRWLIVGLACLLIAVLGSFLIYARYRIRHFGKDLPGKLGINIQQTANGFTYSQSEKGHTIFTIHASKLVQFKGNGHAVLHDVAITLFGPPGTNREDHVYGSDFDYDQNNGIASAQGEVQIDLQSPQKPASEQGSEDQVEKRTIHVKASGLVFNQKTGIATTNQPLEFQLPKAAGKAVGATFDSKQGVLVLDKQVELTTSSNGEPASVRASHAQMLRDSRQVFLLNAETEFRNERSTADQAVVYFREDGSAERIDAKGNVHTVLDDGTQTSSQTANVLLDAKSQPTQAVMGGGVNFISKNDTQSMHGSSEEGTITFGADAALRHAQFRDAVSFVDQQFNLDNDPHGSATRQVQASKLDIDFTAGPDKKAIAQKVLAKGNAVGTLRAIPSKGPEQNTTISADQLLATLSNGRAIQQLDGAGHTKVVDQAQDGSISASSGDVLRMTFVPQHQAVLPLKSRTAPTLQAAQIDTAVQEGNVSLTQTPAKDAKTQSPLRATARRAEYHAADQVLHLTGSPRINNGAIDLTAQLVDYHRDTGDAAAKGDVKATYLRESNQQNAQSGSMFGGEGPVHIVASEADLQHASDDSIFRGKVRMWQGANAVSAPVIELSRTQQKLQAHGDSDSRDHAVDTTIASAIGSKHQQGVIRVKSSTLVYSDKERRGDFNGDVVAVAPDGTIRSDHAQFFLQPVTQQKAQGPAGSSSQIEKIIAEGKVALTQPGRKGEGEKLVYSAATGNYVLTGTPANPPHISDVARGTTTGAALIFDDQDDSVEVSGGQSAAVTKTRVPR
ncbi:LPS export ABC transporter periplasmic protein LptC [Alloacidobacterium dinghuense]|uniref:LPS export ABC transporter periplasmic protein LptC n=1 Tax=Alloacidobacterium dinghuense TaxID=2763107 RepID=A0A7G8BP21_9BACT|nr:LptA/OstA family protein [Alloacidobacterium dinghuense]QNI34291.1 LPS export ABC transporter periplasmic protein LptC [Alloacidobacterium dinghuense]